MSSEKPEDIKRTTEIGKFSSVNDFVKVRF